MKLLKQWAMVCLASIALLSGCSTTTDPADTFKGETAEHIFHQGEIALRKGNYRECIKRFEALEVQYPYDKNSELAQLHIIYAYYMSEDYPSAESAADRFIQLHPVSRYTDYAYYLRGVANYYQNLGVYERLFAIDLSTRDLEQIKKSWSDFAAIAQQFPKSRYAAAARQYMIHLRNLMAKHIYGVAEFYYKRGAYVAAANRANEVVQGYQGAPVVPDALVLMVKSYRAMHLTQSADSTMRILKYNYPAVAKRL
ncbi:MAG: outer membrane protein assembly factor BamD [Gammaproteobacteria bacterium]|nr:outer membrane protein assembly factor BamD [Gammaproteobacteria bacterium]